MNDRFLSMQLFARVARTGSFSLAGRETGLSQPSVSRIVASLEKRVGVPLLRRTTRGVRLTDAGIDYLARTDDILAALDEADHAVRGTGELQGILKVACSSTFAERSIMPCLREFTAAHPKLRLDFKLSDYRQDIATDGIDIAFRLGIPVSPASVIRTIGTNRRMLVASPSYLAAAGIPQKPDDLAAHCLIIGPAGRTPDGWTFTKLGISEIIRAEARYSFDGTEAATSAAVSGLGIASTADLACRQEINQGSLVEVLSDWKMASSDVRVMFADGRAAKPAARAFAAFMGKQWEKRTGPA